MFLYADRTQNGRMSRRALTATTALGGALALLAAAPAFAANECGAATDGAVTCTADGNPYADGIRYTPTDDLHLTTEADVAATNTVSVVGAGATHVTNNGTITTTGEGSTFSPGAQGIYARGSSVVVDGTGAISTSGFNARGIDAAATGDGTVTINVGDVTTTGIGGGGPGFFPNSSAIFANTYSGAIDVTAGTLSTAGDFAAGVQALSSTGDITIATGDITTTGNNASGIFAQTYGEGSAVVTSTGTINTSGQAANGVYVNARSGTASATVGDVSTTGFNASGIVLNGGTAANADFGSVTTADAFATGVRAQATGDVTVTGADVTTAGVDSAGIYAFSNTGTASVTTTGTVATGAGSSRGIYAYSYSGDANVTAANVSTTGNDSNAIIAHGANATVTVTGDVSTLGQRAYSGDRADAVNVAATGGVATVNNNGAVSSAGDYARGIYARGTDGVTITGAGSTTTAGNYANAIDAYSAAGPVAITTGAVSTSGNSSTGVLARSNENDVTVATGAITTTGAFGNGVNASSGIGAASVTTGAITTSGNYASGVLAYSSSGDVTVNTASVATTGANATGIVARGGGDVNVTTGTASSQSREAVYAGSFEQAATVTLNGATTGAGGTAVFIAAATDATLNVGTGGSLTSAGGTVDLLAGERAIINNAGAITGNGTDAIIRVFNSTPLTFNNSGSFEGLIGVAEGSDDTVNNSGTFTARYDQDFDGGTDSFNNSGTFVVPVGTVSLTGLESFNNSGLVDLRNGTAGDVLNLSSTFTGTGASTLGIDVAPASGSTASVVDRLNAAGAITGSTSLAVTTLGANALLNPGVTFATGGEGSSASAFTVSAGSVNQGLIRYDVVYNAANNSYALVATPGDAVFRALKINEGAQQLWHRSADAWSAHMGEVRDAHYAHGGESGGRMWGQFYGAVDRRENSKSVSAFGVSRTVNLNYKQDSYGGQVGLDLMSGGGGNLVAGVTGGYLNSSLGFSGSADRASYQVVNGGAYLGYVSGNLFANALGKFDYIWASSTGASAGYSDRFHGMSYGAQGEAGVRFGGDSFYAEPVATIAYVRTDLNDIRALGQRIDFDNLDGLRGKAGLRIGSKLALGNGAVAVLYAQGNYVHEFEGKNGITFISGNNSLDFNNRRIGDYGEAKLGFNATTPGGVTGFLEAFGDYSDNYKGAGGRAGLRLNF